MEECKEDSLPLYIYKKQPKTRNGTIEPPYCKIHHQDANVINFSGLN